MPRAELTLTVPDDVWIGDVSRRYDAATFRILSALPGEDTGVGLAEMTAADLPELLSDVEGYDAVDSLELLGHREDTALVQFETDTPLLLSPVQGSGVPLEMPFTIEDGEARWEITAPRHRLSELGRQLDEFGIPFQVERIEQGVEADRLLTETQRELVDAAVESGYYDTPRECSLTDLSERLDIAKSTCSETLHRAEEQIIKEFVDRERAGPSLS
ncbi:helix-turn-helix domain-containing protein [Haloarcula litorea]|uniref:helix-turn-helix domain-containing protein n=1 Tax=Haloarcula litorea TaxID=3032579 RepID=UPI0023E86025|nr:helix-turn-helix domain-containing protein [Halomicroarcula sp. GDY20]